MRHHKAKRKLGRVKRVRVALLRSLARSLVLQEGIVTSEAKAKELRPFVERLVTASKENTLSSRRLVETRLGGAKDAAAKLHSVIAPRYKDRSGGYTRIIHMPRTGKRVVESAKIEFVA